LRIAVDLLKRADAFLFGLPPGAFDLDPFFLVRERLNLRTPFVYLPLGEFPRGAWCYRNIGGRLREQDAVLFSCRADRAIHDTLVASTPARVAVAPFGIESERFSFEPAIRAAERRRLGIGPGAVVFVYHGRVTAEKNVTDSIALFRRLAMERRSARFWIIGEVDDRPPDFGAPFGTDSLRQAVDILLADHRLARRLTFWGNLPTDVLPRMLAAADVAVNLTLNGDENFGYSAVEAMAAGLPVIGADWGGLKDTIEHQVTGFRVPTVVTRIGVAVDHCRALQYARTLAASPELRRSMGAGGRERVRRHFTLEGFAAAAADLIHAQLSARPEHRGKSYSWSVLGRRLTRLYSAPIATDPSRIVPRIVPATRTLFADHSIMRSLVRHYATARQNPTLVADAVFFLASALFDLEDDALVSRDPRYVCSPISISPADGAVVATLAHCGFMSLRNLERELEPEFASAAVKASLRRLLRAGVALQSEDAAEHEREDPTRVPDQMLCPAS
jgi:glycosyltransferase involved in cell wall biosynthesis